MSIKKKILISTIAVLTLVLGGVMVTHADGDTPSAEDLLSTGRTEIDVDNDGIPDAVFDAKDLKDIATSVENGKSSLATSINAYPNADVAPLATFPELSSAIDNLTAVPDIYYYDKATEGDSCVRYMYENGSYYPCNEYGEKTSDTALSGTITVVTKDDTTEPAAGEIQLVKYESTSAANLSAGSAGYADKSFILGSGSDNITYRNNHVLEYGTVTLPYMGYGSMSSQFVINFSKNYSASDNVYLCLYNIKVTDVYTNVYLRGSGKVTGNSKWIQATNQGTVHLPAGSIVYWALIRIEELP